MDTAWKGDFMSSILGRVANGVKKTFVVLYTSTLAKNSIFDPTGTSLSSTNAEDAIKEVDGKIDDIEYVDIPYADFSWNQNNRAFVCPNISTYYTGTILCVMVVPLNLLAIMGGYIDTQDNNLSVCGWIPIISGSIANTAQFKCTLIVKHS